MNAPDNSCTVLALYQFVQLDDASALKSPLQARCEALGLKGTLLLAEEGINGTVAGAADSIDALLRELRADPRLDDLRIRRSRAGTPPFNRMKVRVKREIVSMGVPSASPGERTGTHVDPARWNELLEDPDVLVIDARNTYETAIGGFEGAVDPQTTNFREFPEYAAQHIDPDRIRRVAMYCTGGIRCEKASALLLAQGVEEVYQLDGGVLRYLEEIDAADSRWRGECFVFDSRVSVDATLDPGSHTQCFACRRALSDADLRSPHYAPGISCGHCFDETDDKQRAAFQERRRQVELAEARGDAHIGQPMKQHQSD